MGSISSKQSLNISTTTKKNGDINGHAGKDVNTEEKITVIEGGGRWFCDDKSKQQLNGTYIEGVLKLSNLWWAPLLIVGS